MATGKELEQEERENRAVWGIYAAGTTIAGARVKGVLRSRIPTKAASTVQPIRPLFKTWNQFQRGTAALFASRAEAAKAWASYRQANGILTGTTRSAAAQSSFLKSLAEDANTPRWMKQWLSQGKTPPGFDVDHILPLSVDGLDIPANMRLQLRELHKLHHKFYRPWESQ